MLLFISNERVILSRGSLFWLMQNIFFKKNNDPMLDLASANKGGKVLETSDELFGEGFHLVKGGPATEDKNRETANGFWKVRWSSEEIPEQNERNEKVMCKKKKVPLSRDTHFLAPSCLTK